MIHFLGFTLEEFLQQPTQSYPFGPGPWPCLNPLSEHYREKVVVKCLAQSNTTANYRTKSVVGFFSCECGFVYSRYGPDDDPGHQFQRRKFIKEFGHIWDAKFTEFWLNPNITMTAMEKRIELSRFALQHQADRLGLPDCGSHKSRHWHQPARKEPSIEEIKTRRDIWEQLLKAHPDIRKSACIRKFRREHSWLDKYDSQWLEVHMPANGERSQSKPRVNWPKRDAELAELVRLTAANLRNGPGRPVWISRRRIGAVLNSNEILTVEHRSLLPLTVKALEDEVETLEQWQIRRIAWHANRFLAEGTIPSRCRLVLASCVYYSRNEPVIKDAIDNALEKLRQRLG
jgi:hypothetical protein